MQLIRLEHPSDGNGLWSSYAPKGKRRYWMMTDETIENITSRHNTSRFPTPDEDSVLKGHFIAGRHKFGFLTIEQMKAAFLPHELAELFGLGFRIYLIEAEEAFKSPYQVIFNPKSVTMKKDISNLFAEVK